MNIPLRSAWSWPYGPFVGFKDLAFPIRTEAGLLDKPCLVSLFGVCCFIRIFKTEDSYWTSGMLYIAYLILSNY